MNDKYIYFKFIKKEGSRQTIQACFVRVINDPSYVNEEAEYSILGENTEWDKSWVTKNVILGNATDGKNPSSVQALHDDYYITEIEESEVFVDML